MGLLLLLVLGVAIVVVVLCIMRHRHAEEEYSQRRKVNGKVHGFGKQVSVTCNFYTLATLQSTFIATHDLQIIQPMELVQEILR